jgi:hypothetical protein
MAKSQHASSNRLEIADCCSQNFRIENGYTNFQLQKEKKSNWARHVLPLKLTPKTALQLFLG